MQFGPGVEVIAVSDEGLWALYKPAGIMSHPNKPGEEGQSLIVAPYDPKSEAFMTDEGPYFLLHRLDGPTSGIILVTPYAQLAHKVRDLFRSRGVKKTYYAIVANFPAPNQSKGMWRDKLGKTQIREGGVRGTIGGGAPAETHVNLIKKFHTPIGSSLLELRPITGRTHQLRIQCAHRGMPIIGDATYGDFALNRQLKTKNLYLHAAKIEIPSMNFHIESHLPRYFQRWGK
jgi:23S rRNA-/tRNA-specific pseudouridylate synthase